MKRKNDWLWFCLFVAPLMFIFLTVVVIPFLIGIGYSFFEWDGMKLNPKVFVGLDNYIKLFTDKSFVSSSMNTVIFTLVAIVLINVLGLAFALIVTSKLKTRNAARAMLFMPYLIGGLILGYIWKFIFTDVFTMIGEKLHMEKIFFN